MRILPISKSQYYILVSIIYYKLQCYMFIYYMLLYVQYKHYMFVRSAYTFSLFLSSLAL